MKPILLMQGPIATRSGYGDHMRDITKGIIELYGDKYEIKILSLKWGECPMTGLDETNPEHMKIINCILDTPQLRAQPDVFIQVSVPNEFQPIGKYNIGITAGIETTAHSKVWLDGLNRMDLIIVPSKHSSDVFKNISFDAFDNKTKKVVDKFSFTKSIEILFEGLDTNIYKRTQDIPESINNTLNEIPEQFAYLFVGHWLQGRHGHDRKDVGTLIETFCEAFKNKQVKPALILKTSGATFSIIDRNAIMKKITDITKKCGKSAPNIYLIHGELSEEEMNGLYNHSKVKVHVSFTKGEGFGRPLLEASVSGKPVIATNFSGHIDFLKHSILLPGNVQQVHKSAVWKDVITAESGWFYVDKNYARKILRDTFKHYKKYLPLAREQAKYSKEKFNLQLMYVILLNTS